MQTGNKEINRKTNRLTEVMSK